MRSVTQLKICEKVRQSSSSVSEGVAICSPQWSKLSSHRLHFKENTYFDLVFFPWIKVIVSTFFLLNEDKIWTEKTSSVEAEPLELKRLLRTELGPGLPQDAPSVLHFNQLAGGGIHLTILIL